MRAKVIVSNFYSLFYSTTVKHLAKFATCPFWDSLHSWRHCQHSPHFSSTLSRSFLLFFSLILDSQLVSPYTFSLSLALARDRMQNSQLHQHFRHDSPITLFSITNWAFYNDGTKQLWGKNLKNVKNWTETLIFTPVCLYSFPILMDSTIIHQTTKWVTWSFNLFQVMLTESHSYLSIMTPLLQIYWHRFLSVPRHFTPQSVNIDPKYSLSANLVLCFHNTIKLTFQTW